MSILLYRQPFSSPEPPFLLVTWSAKRRALAAAITGNACVVFARISAHAHSRPQSLRSFWPAAGIESSGRNHFEITKKITEFCPSGLIQSSSMAHARNGCSQSSRFLPQARRIVGSGDENGSCSETNPEGRGERNRVY